MADQAQKLRDMVDQKDGENDSVDLTSPSRRSRVQPVSRAEVLTVTSGKGGVGKTNVAVNIGLALQQTGKKVAVVDMDLGMANVNVLTNVSPALDLFDVYQERHSVRDVLVDGPGGIKIAAGASGKDQLANLGSEQCQVFLEELAELDRMFDVIIVDTSAGISTHVLHFVRAADRTILVTTPEPTAITDAYALVKSSLRKRPRPNFQILVNRSTTKVAEKMSRVGKEFINVDLDILGFMVEDQAVNRAVRSRSPFLEKFPDSKVSQCIQHIARRVEDPEHSVKPTGVEGFFES
ncbi:MAG: P-loop NTPase, partial [bacterium]